jgi:peptidyl-dipeptidase Dcp
VLSFDNATDLEGFANDLCCSNKKSNRSGHEGQYLIGLQNTTQQPLQNLSNRTTREKYSKRLGLAQKNDDGDTASIIKMARLRLQKPI